MARHPPETRYAQSSGAKIAYQVSGTGPPDLVMVPGLVSHLDIQWQQTGYRRFVRALERGGRLIRLDKRGTGLSDPAAELPTTQERVRDVAAVMAAAKTSRAVLFGLSDGGRAAIAFAAAYPGRTRGLILYGTSYRGPRAALLRRYRSMVRHWGQGQIVGLVAPAWRVRDAPVPSSDTLRARSRPCSRVPGPGPPRASNCGRCPPTWCSRRRPAGCSGSTCRGPSAASSSTRPPPRRSSRRSAAPTARPAGPS